VSCSIFLAVAAQKLLVSSFDLVLDVFSYFFMKCIDCNLSSIMILCIPIQEEFLIGSISFEQTADFFRGDNREGVEARNEVSELLLLLQY